MRLPLKSRQKVISLKKYFLVLNDFEFFCDRPLIYPPPPPPRLVVRQVRKELFAASPGNYTSAQDERFPFDGFRLSSPAVSKSSLKYTADFIKKVLSVYTHSMTTIYLSLS